jgi:hypothetical protein
VAGFAENGEDEVSAGGRRIALLFLRRVRLLYPRQKRGIYAAVKPGFRMTPCVPGYGGTACGQAPETAQGVDREWIREVEAEPNGRPRRMHGYRTPAEVAEERRCPARELSPG